MSSPSSAVLATLKYSAHGASAGAGIAVSWISIGKGSASGGLERVGELSCLVRRQFDDKTAAAFQRYAHDDAAAFLRDFERAVTRPRLHRRHPASPSLPGAALRPWRACRRG